MAWMKLKSRTKTDPSKWLFPPTRKLSPGENERESIRQWMISELCNTYFFPKPWLSNRVRLVGQNPMEIYGFCLLTSKGDPFLFVAIEPGNLPKAEKALRDALRTSPYGRLGICTDGTVAGTRILRQRCNSDECDYVPELESFSGNDKLLANAFRAPSAKKTESNYQLEPISESLEDVFFEAHSHIRDIDGLHADEALDELCKILYAKLFDEEITAPGEAYSLQSGIACTVEEFAAVIRRVYQDANEYDVRVFSLKIPGYDRSRGVFNSPIRLSSPALVKVVETIQSYWLTRSSIDVKGRAFQRVLGPTLRAGMGQYFTPLEVIQLIVDVVQPSLNDLVLDPFSGSGHFLTQSLDLVRSNSKKTENKRLHEFAFNKLHGIEKSDRMVRVAMTDMRLHGDGHSNIRCTDALLDFQNYPDIRPESFDIIMTNPPFGSLLSSEAIAQLGEFEFARCRKNVPLEVLGLERCVQFLRPGGKLGIVLPDGIVANRATDYVREWLSVHLKIRAIVSLPIETFSPFGANIKTCIVFARKWKAGEKRTADYKVQLTKVDNVGYDSTGRLLSGSDIKVATEAIKTFLIAEGW